MDASIICQPDKNTLVLIVRFHNLMPNYEFIFSVVHFNFSWKIFIIPMVGQNNIIAIRKFPTYQYFLPPILKTVSKWENVYFAREGMFSRLVYPNGLSKHQHNKEELQCNH
jgi:hypothetical protein